MNRSYTKSRLLKELAWKVGVKQALSQKILDALAEIIYREAAIGGFVLPGVCKFDVVDKKERRMRNPRTGEALVIPPHKALRVTLSNTARNAIAPKPKAVPLSQYVPPVAAAPQAEEPKGEEPKSAEAARPEAVVAAPAPMPVPEPAPASAPVEESPKPEASVVEAAPAPAPAAEEPKAEEPKSAEAARPEAVVAAPESALAEESAPAEEPAPVPEPAPAPAPEAPKAEAPAPATGPVPEPAPAEEGAPVSFRCPGCGQEIEAPAEAIGCEAECPMCGRILVVPKASEPGTMYGPATGAEQPKAEEPVVSAKEAEDMDPQQLKNRTIRIDTTLFGFDDDDDDAPKRPETPPVGEEKMISFFCKNCHQEIEATADMAGSQCECPNCGNTFEVPYFSDAGSIHDDSAAKREAQRRIEAQKHSTMRINLDDF